MRSDRREESYCTDQSALWDRIEATAPFPLSAIIAVTERCNLSCPHCYVPDPGDGGEMTTSQIVNLLDQLADAGVLKLTYTGGEPALRPDLAELVKAAATRHFEVHLKSSASLLDLEDVDDLWEAGLAELNVSLYSDRPEEHDGFVGLDGAWKRAVDSLTRFKSRGGIARVSVVAMNWNAARVSAIVDRCEENDWPYIVDIRVSVTEDGSMAPCRFRVDEEAVVKLLADDRLVSPGTREKSADSIVCLAGRRGPYIRADGEVWACPSLSWSFGNVLHKPIVEIWNGSKVREKLLSLRWGDSKRCGDCEFKYACERCPGDAVWEHGDHEKPSEYDCFLARARTRAWAKR